MIRLPLLKEIEGLRFAGLSAGRLADYAYALTCCRFPATVADGDSRREIVRVCDRKLADLRHLIGDGYGPDAPLDALDQTPLMNRDLSGLSVSGLVRLHARGHEYAVQRQERGMETFTRVLQWRVVDNLISRGEDPALAAILMLAECLEAGNHARHLGLPYSMGERHIPFSPSGYPDDDALIRRIKTLSIRRTFLSREELIDIADYILMEIVEKGETAGHLKLVNAILTTGMPCFEYPAIARELEKSINRLAKTNAMTRIELAPAYNTLWGLTLKPSYLTRFENTVRHCYFTLAKDKVYPGLGVDMEDPRSISAAIKFLDENRRTLWILSDRYDVDKVIRKYQPVPGVSPNA